MLCIYLKRKKKWSHKRKFRYSSFFLPGMFFLLNNNKPIYIDVFVWRIESLARLSMKCIWVAYTVDIEKILNEINSRLIRNTLDMHEKQNKLSRRRTFDYLNFCNV